MVALPLLDKEAERDRDSDADRVVEGAVGVTSTLRLAERVLLPLERECDVSDKLRLWVRDRVPLVVKLLLAAGELVGGFD